jgi:hypothetical protein
MKLAQRHNPKTNLNSLDMLLKTNYERNYTVLMYEFELEEIEREKGATAGMNLKFKALDIVKPAIERWNGIALEDSLWIFEDSVDAVRAALAMQRTLKSYNAN